MNTPQSTEPAIGTIAMSPGQIACQWDGKRWNRRTDLDGLTWFDAVQKDRAMTRDEWEATFGKVHHIAEARADFAQRRARIFQRVHALMHRKDRATAVCVRGQSPGQPAAGAPIGGPGVDNGDC